MRQVPPLQPRPPEGEELLHTRDYRVDVYRAGPTTMRIRGQLRDVKPNGLEMLEDDTPMVVHHMVVDLLVEVPSLEITTATPVMETRPHHDCSCILDHYQGLVGLSIARGFTHKVRELFGGPRGCTHTTMLLQAMAPVAIQTTWSMQPPGSGAMDGDPDRSEDEIRGAMRHNLNTCHVWDEDGEQVAQILGGGRIEEPLWATERLVALGRDPQEWRSRR